MKWIKQILTSLARFDWILMVAVFVLTVIGLATIYSIDLSRGDSLVYFPTQVIALIIGICVVVVVGSIHMAFYRSSARLFYLAAFFILLAVLFFGVEIRGTRGWFRFAGFSFQPAEFAKLALVLFMGWLVHRYGRQFKKIQFVIASGIVTFVLAGLILLQPDLGSASVLIGLWFGMLLLTGTKKRYILGLIGIGVVVAVIGWFFILQPYQKDRLITFIDPQSDPLETGYNVNQSLIAIGAGEIKGRGLGFGSQSQLHFLPEAQTDFIFSVISEELGFIGVLLILALFFVVLWRLIRIAAMCEEDFAAYTVLGVALVFFIQMLVNIGGTLGLLPVTGVTLPFLSYGGSSLIMNFFLIGLSQSIAKSLRTKMYEFMA